MPPRVALMLPLAHPAGNPDGLWDYAWPFESFPQPGQLVRAPFGRREVTGFVCGEGTGDVPEDKIRPITSPLDTPPLPDAHRRFLLRAAQYTLQPAGAFLKMSLPPDSALRANARTKKESPPIQDVSHLPPLAKLSPSQSDAAMALTTSVAEQTFSVTVLDGVTGSGKTEVYFAAIREALSRGLQALVLLPEIALATQWHARFAERFGFVPATWHSSVSERERRLTWKGVATGSLKLVVGARSALFLPFQNLGVIVVDEEHEPSYKQEEGIIYHARDLAVLRAHAGEIPIVLASATPSLETVANIRSGRYRALHLPTRHGHANPPVIQAIDLKATPPPKQSWLSPPLREALAQTFTQSQQAMLFLNRRGYAPLMLCRACGHRLACPDCDSTLVYHAARKHESLHCHHCGYHAPPPTLCPECGAEDQFTLCGPGVERVAEEAASLFPQARMALMTSDHAADPATLADMVRRMEKGELDLLIGTQMMAKGHHFPRLTLVGVVDADLGLQGGDLRASERIFQMLFQVAGRAGREDLPGKVLLQTHTPEHPVMQALVEQNRDRFMDLELAFRKHSGMPPYTRLASLLVTSLSEEEAHRTAMLLAKKAPQITDFQVLGPSPAPIRILRKRHRYRLLIKAEKTLPLSKILRDWLTSVTIPSSVRLKVDIDPYNFL
ncbi:MAG: primosomal protein N' [Alphaproteobacteria bacterium]|nr:primosomal protein N' [Alphaproteobacteria bacterium]